MAKTATTKCSNKKRIPAPSRTNQMRARRVAAAAAAVVVVAAAAAITLTHASGNAGNSSKKRKKKLSHQQASEARHMLDAEFRDLRSGNLQQQPPSGAATTATTMAVPRPSDHLSEQSAGVFFWPCAGDHGTSDMTI
ncbi:hypothetical protein BJV78DRAFT_1349898 [Lactifluus subvellereus]|nr:hypothetical protein BJV78DRAFT_1349898 [Lactifluus subvellereus]